MSEIDSQSEGEGDEIEDESDGSTESDVTEQQSGDEKEGDDLDVTVTTMDSVEIGSDVDQQSEGSNAAEAAARDDRPYLVREFERLLDASDTADGAEEENEKNNQERDQAQARSRERDPERGVLSYLPDIIDPGIRSESPGEASRARVERVLDHAPDHPLFEAIAALDHWYNGTTHAILDDDRESEGTAREGENSRYERGAMRALFAFKSAADRFEANGYDQLALKCLLCRAELKTELNGHSPAEPLEGALNFLVVDDRLEHASLRDVFNLFEQVGDSADDPELSPVTVDRAFHLADEYAHLLHERGDYRFEREGLEQVIDLAQTLGRIGPPSADVSAVEILANAEIRIVASVEASVAAQNTPLNKAFQLRDGLSNYVSHLEQKTQDDWMQRMRDYNEEGRSQVPVMQSEVDLGDGIEAVIDDFNRFADSVSSDGALLTLATLDGLLPRHPADPDREPLSFVDMVSQVAKDNEHLPVGVTPALAAGEAAASGDGKANHDSDSNERLDGDEEREPGSYRVPVAYGYEIATLNTTIAAAFQRLQARGRLHEGSFYVALNELAALDENDQAFITEAIRLLFQGEECAAIHIGICRLEGVIRRSLEAVSENTAALQRDGSIRSKTLNPLIDLIEREDAPFAAYLRYRYADPSGSNERNETAHSKLLYRNANYREAVITLFDLLRIGVRVQRAFGESDRGKEVAAVDREDSDDKEDRDEKVK